MKICELDTGAPETVRLVTQVWTAACGPDLAITERFARFNLEPAAGTELAGCVALHEGSPAGFVLASVTLHDVAGLQHPSGWIEALAVLPEYQRQGVGSSLLEWAQTWLAQRGCTSLRLGGGLRPFVPGLPVQLDREAFFRRYGFQPAQTESVVWDMAGLLDRYRPPDALKDLAVSVRPLQAGEEPELDAFLAREFPGRWRYEFQEHLRQNGRPEDYLLLWTSRGVDGFCQITLEDSLRPLDRFYMHGLPRPWGQLGPIGISAGCRGQGLGTALIDGALRFLRERGTAACIIDWTHLRTYYEKFGFYAHRQYLILYKELIRRA
jgi:predicted N-acetyltransferase YhbS